MPKLLPALIGSTHPGPAAAVTIISVVLGVGVGLEPWRVVVLGLAVAANQASVGLSNDWIDAERDRVVGRTDKPIVRGDVSVALVRTAAGVTAAAAIALTVPLGIWATAAHTVFLISAWSYNLGLKSTVISVLPYLVSFGLLPSVVTLSQSEPAAAASFATVLGALLGAAAHFANVLPDLADDRRTGVRGLPHRLGSRASGLITWAALIAAGFAGFVAPSSLPPALSALALGINLVIAAAGIAIVLTRAPSRLLFRLIIVAALVDVVVLATAGRALSA